MHILQTILGRILIEARCENFSNIPKNLTFRVKPKLVLLNLNGRCQNPNIRTLLLSA